MSMPGGYDPGAQMLREGPPIPMERVVGGGFFKELLGGGPGDDDSETVKAPEGADPTSEGADPTSEEIKKVLQWLSREDIQAIIIEIVNKKEETGVVEEAAPAPAPATEETVPATEETAPSTNTAAPSTNATAPSTNATAPSTNATAPAPTPTAPATSTDLTSKPVAISLPEEPIKEVFHNMNLVNLGISDKEFNNLTPKEQLDMIADKGLKTLERMGNDPQLIADVIIYKNYSKDDLKQMPEKLRTYFKENGLEILLEKSEGGSHKRNASRKRKAPRMKQSKKKNTRH